MWVTASRRARVAVLAGWSIFAVINLVAMWQLPGVETIPFHLVWTSIALVFGTNAWPIQP